MIQFSRLDEAQGASKERTKLYLRYCEGVPELATSRFAKSGGKVFGFAGKLTNAAGEL